jgi:hypothetical protein
MSAAVSGAARKALLRVLTTPARLAGAFDWRRGSGCSLLSLDVHADHIGLALASHPSSSSPPSSSPVFGFPTVPGGGPATGCRPLEPIRLVRDGNKKNGRTAVPPEARQRLADLVRDHRVCGFVVSWPLQRDTGRMGAPCGRTLFTLEQLLAAGGEDATAAAEAATPTGGGPSSSSSSPASSIFTPNRPLCLWDPSDVRRAQPPVDEFGRCAAYAQTAAPNKTVHSAEREQYFQEGRPGPAQVWEDFSRTFWPAPSPAAATASAEADPTMRTMNRGATARTLGPAYIDNGRINGKTTKTTMVVATAGRPVRKPAPASLCQRSSTASWRDNTHPTRIAAATATAATIAAGGAMG